MFIDEDHTASVECGGPDEIAVQQVLAACASEAIRQAHVMTGLDSSIGSALAILRQGREGQVRHPPAGLVSSLQQADRLRQEMEGLAKVLALLADIGGQTGTVDASRIRACTPFRDLQERLLSRGSCLEVSNRVQAFG
jgi:hypothetical protein